MMKQKKKNNLTKYYDGLQSQFAAITLIVVSVTIIGSLFQLVRFLLDGPNNGSLFGHGILGIITVLIPLITVGGGFGAGLLTTIGQPMARSERIIRSGALGIMCNVLYAPLFGYVLFLSFRYFGVIEWLTESGPLLALILTALFAFIVRKQGARGRRVLMAGFTAVIIITLVSSTVETLRYGSTPTIFDVIPIVAAIVFYALLRPIGRLARVFYGFYIVCLIIFASLSVGSFVWDSTFNAVSIIGIVSVVAAIMFFVTALYILIRLRIPLKGLKRRNA